MKENEYRCAMCGGIFKKGRPDEEAWEEHDVNFPGDSHETAKIVCDDCYRQMVAIEPPPGMKEEGGTAHNGKIDGLMKRYEQPDCDWVRLAWKNKKPWWWNLLHPRKARQRKYWIKATDEMLKVELDKIDFNKLAEEMLVDQACYGTSWREGFIPDGVNGIFSKAFCVGANRIFNKSFGRKEKP